MCAVFFRRYTNRILVLSQRAQIKSIKQMNFLSKQTQNRWKFEIATVRGVLQIVTLYFKGGLNTCDEMWQGGEGVDFCPK